MTGEAILVTGAGGFVGRQVVAALQRRGRAVLALEHRWSGTDGLARLLAGHAPARAIHLGWYADPHDYRTAAQPNLRSLQDSLDLATLLVDRGCRHLVVAGTSAEYAPSGLPLSEDSPIAPNSVYGAAKASLHLLLRSSLCAGRLDLAWTRLFNITGAGEHPARLVPAVVRALLRGQSVPLTSGDQIRDVLDVEDVAEALVRLSLAQSVGTFNVSSGRGRSLRHLLCAVAERAGNSHLLDFGRVARAADDPDVVVGRNDLLRQATGWEPRFDLGATVERAVSYWRLEGTVEATA